MVNGDGCSELKNRYDAMMITIYLGMLVSFYLTVLILKSVKLTYSNLMDGCFVVSLPDGGAVGTEEEEEEEDDEEEDGEGTGADSDGTTSPTGEAVSSDAADDQPKPKSV